MRVLETMEIGSLARIFLLQLRSADWSMAECVGALDPALPGSSKMVLVVSTQFGCAMGCRMCDASGEFHGNLSADEIFAQIDLLLETWAGSGARDCPKLKIQFARMGEPTLNPAVLGVLEQMPHRYSLPGLLPCIATMAPSGCGDWLERLMEAKDRLYGGGMFQLQFSVQSTDESRRREMIPACSWSLGQMAAFADRFVKQGDRKVALNFALAGRADLDPAILSSIFCSRKCLVKLTPLNPTASASRSGLGSALDEGGGRSVERLVDDLMGAGFEVIVSRGLEIESRLGSSCGQRAFSPKRTAVSART
jgi:23S rRNA (adenine2503-C2)-methyltransferase